MKLARRLLIVIPVFLVLVAVVAFLFLDSIAKQAIERSGSYALGVDTELDSADIGLFSGRFRLDGLNVANPQGFKEPHFLELEQGTLALSAKSLLKDRVSVPLLEIIGVQIDLERNQSGTNYEHILKHLERFESSEAPVDDQEASGKSFALDRLVIRDARAKLDLLPIGGEATKVSITIPEIVLENLDSSEMSTAEICALVVKVLLNAAIKSGAGVIPADLLREFEDQLQGLRSVAFDISGEVTHDVEGVVQRANETLQQKTDEALKDAGKKLDGILRGK